MKLSRRESLALLTALTPGLAGCSAETEPAPQRSTGTSTEPSTTDPTPRETTAEGTPDPTFEDLPTPAFPDVDPVTSPSVGRETLAEQVRGNVAVTLDLFEALRDDDESNLFFSPYSVSTALAMTWAGARGETETTMADALRFASGQDTLHRAFADLDAEFERRNENGREAATPESDGSKAGPAFELSVANALWPQAGLPLRESFAEVLRAHYDAEPTPLDFASDPEAARERINEWVADETNDRIPDLLSPKHVTPQTRLVLANAIYYRARWKHPFDEGETRERPFTALDGTTTDVPTMHREGKYEYARVAGHQLVELPYANGRTSMVILLPADGEYESFVSSLTVDRLATMLDAAETALVDLALPRFGVDSKTSLRDALSALGMAGAFTPDADFSGMVEGGGVWLDDVVHQSAVEVDELGTEAVAATAALVTESLPSRRPELTIDRPFLFYVRDRPTETPLFFGQVVDAPQSP